MRVLLDTNLLVRAAITPEGLARQILDHIGAKDEHVLILSGHLLSEVADVLSRPRIRARWPLSDDEIQMYLVPISRWSGSEDPAAAPSHLRSEGPSRHRGRR